ncbi:glycosyltransferase family 4 protein [Candidatus Villigracilis affinis]|uniref:glycosyltransferase family 4 protein n=1 Tax=Candidatus Villigracilis affinis TaxID=3140682 RepID=UPI001DB983D0|nr:glycosyltransferase family 4 protein [Anaerolineales bacterium]
MNIAILHYSVPPIVGGVESVIGHHARLMSANGHSVRLIAARGESLNNKILLTELPLADSRHERVAHMKDQLDRGEVTPDFESLRDELVIQLQTTLASVDILIAHNVCSLNKNLALTAALYQLHISKKLPRLILWHHDLAWTTPRYQPELHDGYPWDLLRTDWGETSHVVVSHLRRRELSTLMKIQPDDIQIIPNGVDAARFYKLESQTQSLLEKTKLLDAAPILLLPVRVTPRKNIELALHTLAELRKQFPNAALVVTGPLGPHNADNHKYFEALSSLRAQLGLQHSAHFLTELTDSFLPDEVIADFYRIADALLFPSREEGFGIPLIEAAFSHLPAFCADIPPLRELGLNDAAFFSPDDDPAKISGMIAEYFQSSPAARLSMRARASFRWEAIYRQHIAPLLK